jgi:hypothetical protein
MGTWKLNEAKTKFAPGRTKNTRECELGIKSGCFESPASSLISLRPGGGRATAFSNTPYRLEADGALKTIDSCLWGQVSPSPSAIHDNCLATLSKIIALRSRILLDKRSFGRRDVANLCSVNRPWVRPLLSAPTENCTMSVFTSTNNEALGKLLADLFPKVALSEVGVALLAAQISNLGGRCATMHSRPIDHKRAK